MKTTIDLSSWTLFLRRKYHLLLLAVVVVLVLAEFFVLKSSIPSSVLSSGNEAPIGGDSRVRVNLDAYQQDLNRIQNGNAFQPSSPPQANPFGTH